jgi:hypothetical protein
MAAISSNAGTFNWNDTAGWNGGVVPVAGDTVTIISGSTITLTDNRQCASITVNGGGTLVFNADVQMTNMTADFLVTGTFDCREGALIEFNSGTSRAISTAGASGILKIVGTAAKLITIRNSQTTVDTQVRYESGPYGSDQKLIYCNVAGYVGQATRLGQCKWNEFYGNTSFIQRPDSSVTVIDHCFFARRSAGNPVPIAQAANLGSPKQSWSNLVCGYRRDGSAAQLTSLITSIWGMSWLRNVIANTTGTFLFGMNNLSDGVYIDNWGFVDPAMLPGTGSALDSAQGNPGISKSWFPTNSTVEKLAAAAIDGSWGCRVVPKADIHSTVHPGTMPVDIIIPIPIASGDNISATVKAKRSSGLGSSCAKLVIDPEQTWFTTAQSSEALNDTNATTLSVSANGARGSGLKGVVHVVLRTQDYAASQTLDWDTLEVIAGGTTYRASMDHWAHGMPAIDPPLGGVRHVGFSGGLDD